MRAMPDPDEEMMNLVEMLIGVLCNKDRALNFMWSAAAAASNLEKDHDAQKFFYESIDNLVQQLLDSWEDGAAYLGKHKPPEDAELERLM